MKKVNIFKAIGLICILLLFLITGCAAEQATDKNILRIRLEDDIRNLDPAFIVGGTDDTVNRAVLEGLIRYLPDSTEIENQLAEWINVSEDGLVIHFKLREGIMWHKGYGELTTEDVKFSFERFIDPELAAAYADDWISLSHVEIIDKYEGKIILKEPQATLWTTTLPLTSGLILSKKHVEEVGAENLSSDIVGTGPYVFGEWEPTQKVTLIKNTEYWGEEPLWDEIHMFPIIDDTAAEVALEAGEFDFSLVSLASADRIDEDETFDVMILPTNSYGWIGMNMENPKLQDINVRKAIRYGIDVPSIIEAAYLGKAERALSLIPPGTPGHWEDAPVYERDVAKAREYLAKAGLASLDLELAVENTMEYRTWAEIVQQNLAEVGINVTINSMDASAFWVIGEGDKGIDVELFALTYTAMPDPAWFTMWFTSDQVGVWNWMRWASPEFDALHKEALVTMDLAERETMYIEMQRLWDEAAHTVWVAHTAKPYAYNKSIIPAMYNGGIIPMIRDFKPAQ